MNRVVLLGRISNDLELRSSSTGDNYVWFTLAVNEVFGSKTITQFIPCVAWGKTATNINQYLNKGSLVLAEGAINVRRATDKNGTPSTIVNVNVNKIHFLEKNQNVKNKDPQNNLLNDYDAVKEKQGEELQVDDGIFWEE